MPEQDLTLVDRWVRQLRNHPVSASLILVGIAVGGLATFTESISKIGKAFGWSETKQPTPPPNIFNSKVDNNNIDNSSHNTFNSTYSPAAPTTSVTTSAPEAATSPSARTAGSVPSPSIGKDQRVPPEASASNQGAAAPASAPTPPMPFGAVSGAAGIGHFSPDGPYYVTEPMYWTARLSADRYIKIIVPVGYLTDVEAFAPRTYLRVAFPRPLLWAAMIHDYIYWTQAAPREFADEILISTAQMTLSEGRAAQIRAAVEERGPEVWASYAQRKEAGEKRVLKYLPPVPSPSWDEWKQRGDDLFKD